jgi:hypothetical protein
MSVGNMEYLGLVVGAFAIFAFVLAATERYSNRS